MNVREKCNSEELSVSYTVSVSELSSYEGLNKSETISWGQVRVISSGCPRIEIF